MTISPDTPLTERRRWLLAGLPFTRTQYTLNSNTLTQSVGLLSPRKKTVSVSQIRNTVTQQSLIQKRFGLCTIRVATDNPLISELVIKNIRSGTPFEGRLRRHVEDVLSQQPHSMG